MNYVYPIQSLPNDCDYNSNMFKDEEEHIDLASVDQIKTTPFKVSLALKESLRATNKIVCQNENSKTYNSDMI
jgi:hypothetical protein